MKAESDFDGTRAWAGRNAALTNAIGDVMRLMAVSGVICMMELLLFHFEWMEGQDWRRGCEGDERRGSGRRSKFGPTEENLTSGRKNKRLKNANFQGYDEMVIWPMAPQIGDADWPHTTRLKL